MASEIIQTEEKASIIEGESDEIIKRINELPSTHVGTIYTSLMGVVSLDEKVVATCVNSHK